MPTAPSAERANLYVESSAVLAWLFGETDGPRVLEMLATAEICISSDLTLVECDRALHRAVAVDALAEAGAAALRARFAAAHGAWHILRLGPAIVERARGPFHGDPIRTLEALHMASALHARAVVPHLAVLSLDTSIRKAASGLGLKLVPPDTGMDFG